MSLTVTFKNCEVLLSHFHIHGVYIHSLIQVFKLIITFRPKRVIENNTIKLLCFDWIYCNCNYDMFVFQGIIV